MNAQANEKVTLEHFVEQVGLEAGFDTQTAKDYVESLFEHIEQALERQESVQVRGFGSFIPHYVNERQGRNPQTGESLTIPAHYNVHFSPSAKLSAAVNAKYAHLAPQVIDEDGEDEDSPVPGKLPWIIGGVILALAIILLIWLFSGSEPKEQVITEPVQTPATESITEPEPQATIPEPAPVIEEEPKMPEPLAKPEPVKQLMPEGRYTIEAGDNLWHVAEVLWGDPNLWPMIYAANKELIDNPDLVFPSVTITVPAQPDVENFSDRMTLLDAYMDAYRNYKRIGKRDKSRWLLYTLVKKYDAEAMERIRNEIPAADVKILESYLSRFPVQTYSR